LIKCIKLLILMAIATPAGTSVGLIPPCIRLEAAMMRVWGHILIGMIPYVE
jgi:hypothetical protein